MGMASYLVKEPVELRSTALSELLAEEERTYWHIAGQQLLGLASQLATQRELAEEQTAAALSFGKDYGRLMATVGQTLPDAVLGFVRFGDALLTTTLQHPATMVLDHRSTLELVMRVNAVLNTVMRAMISAFEGAVMLDSAT